MSETKSILPLGRHIVVVKGIERGLTKSGKLFIKVNFENERGVFNHYFFNNEFGRQQIKTFFDSAHVNYYESDFDTEEKIIGLFKSSIKEKTSIEIVQDDNGWRMAIGFVRAESELKWALNCICIDNGLPPFEDSFDWG